MVVTTTLIQKPVTLPPPSTVHLSLDLSTQETKLLRAMLGNVTTSQHSAAISGATTVPPIDKTSATVQEQGYNLASAIAAKLVAVLADL